MAVHQVSTIGSKATAVVRQLSCALIPAIALALVGCDRGASSQSPAAPAPKAQPKVSKPVQDPLATMARAVAVSKSDVQVELSYELQAKPKPGGTVEVKLLFTPTADAESLTADIGVAQPLSAAGELKPTFNNVKVGQMDEHRFTVNVPADTGAGIYLVNIVVSLKRGDVTSTKSFAIPLIVGALEATGGAADG